jgi:ABC-type phosphate transport system substrate-binding protein
MKSFRLIQLVAALLLFSASAIARQNSAERVLVEAPRFAIPLVEKWASEYEKVHPGIEIVLIGEKPSGESADLSLVSFVKDEQLPANQTVFYTGRYVLLPVANEENPLLDELNRKRVNSSRLVELFFEKDGPDTDSDVSKKRKHDVTIYSGNNADSFAASFAAHFGYEPVDLKGRKISGDDIYLIHAVQNDNEGVTFNNLSYLFDIETRRLKEGLALIPLDLKKEHREVLHQADIDKTINLLENESIPLIPVEDFGFIYGDNNLQARNFLAWILAEGQQYNHAFGFLQVKDEMVAAQLKEREYLPYTASSN